MKVQIFGPPRSGTTSLYEALRDNINYTMGLFEPLNPGMYYEINEKNKINHLNIINNCKINIIEKNVITENPLHISNTQYQKILTFYKLYFNSFDKLIFLVRKNIEESAKSLAIAKTSQNWFQPYKDINIDYTSLLPLIKSFNQMMEDLSQHYDIPLIYYEDLYSGDLNYIDSFLKYYNIKPHNLHGFYTKLDPKNRLKHF
jgi:hypothetical protein